MFTTVPLPPHDGTDPGRTVSAIAEWARSEPLAALVDRFGGRLPDGIDTDSLLDRLDRFSAEHWDFRGGAERSQAVRRDFPGRTAELVIAAARALGLVVSAPPRHRAYRHLLVLGGLAGACRDRTRHAARLIADGVRVDTVSMLGGFRPLTPAETDLPGLADCRYEIDVMALAARDCFPATAPEHTTGSGDPTTGPNTAERVTGYPAADTAVHVVAAPSRDPRHRRANTADTCRYWAEQVVAPEPGDTVLVVTSQIYVPFQHCDAVTDIGLRYRCAIETVGVAAAGPPRPDRCLQEIRSAIRSMRRLHRTASGSAVMTGRDDGTTG